MSIINADEGRTIGKMNLNMLTKRQKCLETLARELYRLAFTGKIKELYITLYEEENDKLTALANEAGISIYEIRNESHKPA